MMPLVNTISIVWRRSTGKYRVCELMAISSDHTLSRRRFNQPSVHIASAVSLVFIWLYKMVDRGRIGQRPLCRIQINSEMARVSQTIDPKGRHRLEEVTVKKVSTVFSYSRAFSFLK